MTSSHDVDELILLAERLVLQVSHWTPPRWRAASSVVQGSFQRSRADAFHATVQAVADVAADAEGQPWRPVPRLDNDLVLPDQLVVVVRDLVQARPDRVHLAQAQQVLLRLRSALGP